MCLSDQIQAIKLCRIYNLPLTSTKTHQCICCALSVDQAWEMCSPPGPFALQFPLASIASSNKG